MKIILHPKQGIEIENIGFLRFGDNENDIAQLLKTPQKIATYLYFYKALGLRIMFNHAGEAMYFHFTVSDSSSISSISVYDLKPFEDTAENMMFHLTEKNNGVVISNGNTILFSNIGVLLWREGTPEEMKILIAEEQENGRYEADKEIL